MFFDVLGIVFLVELLIGIGIGWLFATFFTRRKDTLETIWGGDTVSGLAMTPSAEAGISGKATSVQPFAPDSAVLQQQVTRLETTVAQMEARLHKAGADLEASRESLERSAAYALSLKAEIDDLNLKLTSEQSSKATLETQLANCQQELAETHALVQMLEASRGDLNKTTLRLQGELDSALAVCDNLQSQITVYKNKMRVVGAQLDPL